MSTDDLNAEVVASALVATLERAWGSVARCPEVPRGRGAAAGPGPRRSISGPSPQSRRGASFTGPKRRTAGRLWPDRRPVGATRYGSRRDPNAPRRQRRPGGSRLQTEGEKGPRAS